MHIIKGINLKVLLHFRSIFIVSFIALLIGFSALQSQSINIIHNSYIIKLNKSGGYDPKGTEVQVEKGVLLKKVIPERNEQLLMSISSEARKELNELDKFYILTGKDTASVNSYLHELESAGVVDYAEPNSLYHIDEYPTPNDPRFSEQWGLATVEALQAWQTASGKDVRVGVVDTGIDFYHPDLIGNIWINPAEDINHNGKFDPWPSTEIRNGVSGDLDGIDNDGNGYADDVIGYDFVDQQTFAIGDFSERDGIPDDENGHGTLVSGVIAAKQNNNIGTSGLAFNAKIVALRAFDITGNAESDDIAAAIVYAANNGIKILNFSFGDGTRSELLRSAIRYAYLNGCAMFASAGNNGWDKPHFPSDFKETASIGASNVSKQKDSQSNYGSNLCVLAPGVNILTTAMGGDYKTASGTSLSAPHAAAVGALLLEVNPELTNEDIYRIIETSATPNETRYWTPKEGSGILNARTALTYAKKNFLKFNYPTDNAVLNRDSLTEIPVIASIQVPFFDSYQLFIGKGVSPAKWDILTKQMSQQILRDTLAKLDLNKLADTVYTLRLSIELKNVKTIEKRLPITIYSSKKPLQILALNVLDALSDNKSISIIATNSNTPAIASLKYRAKGSNDKYKETTDNNSYTTYHQINIGDEVPSGVEMEASLTLHRFDGVSVQFDTTFARKEVAFEQNNFTEKSYSISMSGLVNATADFYNEGKPCIAVNNLPGGAWQSTKIYEFSENKFKSKDSIMEIWIPSGLGDSNGDGIPELFARSGGKSRLFQSKNKGGNPFSETLFADSTFQNLWAASMSDLDRDGNPELIASSDTAFHVFKYNSGDYRMVAQSPAHGKLPKLGTLPGFAAGDFDGDGNNEIMYCNEKGNIFIDKYYSNKLINQYINDTNFSSGSQYMTAIDYDGDGTKEVLIMSYGTYELYNAPIDATPIWTVKVIKYLPVTGYSCVWKQHILGVQSGTIVGNLSYKNGISAGNLNTTSEDEIIISAFPNLYVFSYNQSSKMIKPFWYCPTTFSNSAIVYDFDKNSINEIGFTTFSKTAFYEFSPASANRPATPIIKDAYAESSSTAYIQWVKQSDAVYYKIYEVQRKSTGTELVYLDSTDKNTIIIHNLNGLQVYEFTVVAFNPSMQSEQSYPCEPAVVYTHNPTQPDSVVQIDMSTLRLYYNNNSKLPQKQVDPGNFEITAISSEKSAKPVNCNYSGDHSLLLTFEKPLETGNCSLNCMSFKDLYNSPTVEKSIGIEIKPAQDPKEELYLKSLKLVGSLSINLEFSEAPNVADALDIENYILDPTGKISAISQLIDNPLVYNFKFDPNSGIGALGKSYFITARNISSPQGKPITKDAGATMAFVLYGSSPDDAFVYPNPIKYAEHPEIYFAGLPPDSQVEIVTLDGELLATIHEIDANGGAIWDGRNREGNYLKSGIYLFKVKSTNSQNVVTHSALKKFAIID